MLLTLIPILACAGCSDPSSKTKASDGSRIHTIAIIGTQLDDPTRPITEAGVRRAAQPLPHIETQFVAPTSRTRDAVLTAVREALSLSPSVVCVAADDDAIAVACVELIRSYNAYAVTFGPIDSVARGVPHVRVDEPEAAELLARNLPSLAGDSKSYLLVHQASRDSAAKSRYLRFHAARPKQDTFFLLKEHDAGVNDPIAARAIVDSLLMEFPNTGIVVTLAPDTWLALPYRALPQKNRIATIGTAPELWPRLANGEAIALVGPLHGEIGRVVLEMAAEVLIPQENVEQRRHIPCELVTRESLRAFSQRYADAAGLEFADVWMRAGIAAPE